MTLAHWIIRLSEHEQKREFGLLLKALSSLSEFLTNEAGNGRGFVFAWNQCVLPINFINKSGVLP